MILEVGLCKTEVKRCVCSDSVPLFVRESLLENCFRYGLCQLEREHGPFTRFCFLACLCEFHDLALTLTKRLVPLRRHFRRVGGRSSPLFNCYPQSMKHQNRTANCKWWLFNFLNERHLGWRCSLLSWEAGAPNLGPPSLLSDPFLPRPQP